ncbi:cobyrinate a,c-diamide synthase [Gloeocapsopsis dulcis]|uniref:Cobyrinate a,c-diamide synthase n=1 Tax=Gloeocapsopsis dulcis AAB1 = 1H9 TaxID=1433147 RepID=A0A6N8FYJ3_9CHRO|nr:cobyrinate a,c-diamide synthase [Gloeocapsopsis dulcis]MUL37682.1 cobyrinic acid a,c-diamide synthase [Gloeocapsopsis dulcis AAB1 = 1H9]WNN88487.1 cobyrinate a,c-diamide synthase [Gloeocapsopsis dulcis]
MSLIIAGERSGVGKTTITLMLLAYLSRRMQVQSFKIGPDYIDPMFHQYVTKRPCRNLDPILTSEAYIKQSFAHHSQGVDCALVEGVMGLFDGAAGAEDIASTAHIARLLELPVLLVIDCSRLSRSVAAIAHGYRSFDPRIKIVGVVLNRVGSDRHLQLLKEALESIELNILGILRRSDDLTIPDRHLGLVPTAEISQLDQLIDRFVQLGETCFDWEKLLPILKKAKIFSGAKSEQDTTITRFTSLRIAVARDRAFSFYYPDNLEILEQLGAEMIYWSPLIDSDLPENIQGLYFGGGFPEVFAQQLTENKSARIAVKKAIEQGMPTYAECGGLMYLSQAIVDFDGKSWSMVGIIPATAIIDSRLTLGYRQANVLQSPLFKTGTVVWGHEFHRSRLNQTPTKPLFELQGYNSSSLKVLEGWQAYQVHASYLHLHFGGNREIPQQFLQCCFRFRESQVNV